MFNEVSRPAPSPLLFALLLELPTEFTSERLLLRCYRPGDGAMYFQMLRTNWDHLYEFLASSHLAVQSEENAEILIRRLMADWNLRNLFIFGIWEKETGVYVGESYLANADWELPHIEVGYFVVQAQTGKGYATEAARATVGFAFEHLGVLRVELQGGADNRASKRVAERCGFVYEGCMCQRHHKKDGTVVDVLMFGILCLNQSSVKSIINSAHPLAPCHLAGLRRPATWLDPVVRL